MPYADNDLYNVVLNSLNKVSGTNADATYYYDWASSIPEGEYMITLDYIGGTNTIATPRFALLSMDLGQSRNFTSSATGTTAYSTRIITHLVPNNITTTNNAQYLLNPNDNSPILLNRVPTNNTFSVQVQNPDGTPYTDSLGAVNGAYVIIIHFLKFNRKLHTREQLNF